MPTPSTITKETLLPLALVIAIATMIFGLATDRQRAMGKIEQNEMRIEATEKKIDYLYDGVKRIEVSLGTLPVRGHEGKNE